MLSDSQVPASRKVKTLPNIFIHRGSVISSHDQGTSKFVFISDTLDVTIFFTRSWILNAGPFRDAVARLGRSRGVPLWILFSRQCCGLDCSLPMETFCCLIKHGSAFLRNLSMQRAGSWC